MLDISQYHKMREETHAWYQTIRAIRCPALNNELVHFSAEGFNHLIYKGNRIERIKQDQVTKFKLLKKAKIILEISTTYQEYEESLRQIWKKKFKKMVQESALIHYRDIKLLSQSTGNLEED